jgi:hypothetical protein
MSDPLLDRGGQPVDPDSVYGRLSREAQERIDATLSAWFGNESELGRYDLEAVKDLGKHVV